MARLVTRVETSVFVDHGTFDLIDDGGEQTARLGGPSAGWLFAGDNSIIVRSAAPYHVAPVTVEVWDGEPPHADGWDDVQTATLRLDSGDAEVNPLVDGEDAELVDVGAPGAYRVRAHSLGRANAAFLARTSEEEPNGVERYLFQFWSARCTVSRTGGDHRGACSPAMTTGRCPRVRTARQASPGSRVTIGR